MDQHKNKIPRSWRIVGNNGPELTHTPERRVKKLFRKIARSALSCAQLFLSALRRLVVSKSSNGRIDCIKNQSIAEIADLPSSQVGRANAFLARH